MGKKNKKPKAWQYYTGSGKVGKLMDRYDVEGVHYGHPDGRSGRENRSIDDVNKDIGEAMMKDYDTRRSFEAAALNGDKGAEKFAKKGFKAGNIYDAWDKYKDLKKEYVGGGGMDGAKNRAGLTHAIVQADRNNLLDSVSTGSQNARRGPYDDNPIKPQYEPSEYLAQARSRVQTHEREILSGQYAESLYDKDARPTDGGGFLARYKLDLQNSRGEGFSPRPIA